MQAHLDQSFQSKALLAVEDVPELIHLTVPQKVKFQYSCQLLYFLASYSSYIPNHFMRMWASPSLAQVISTEFGIVVSKSSKFITLLCFKVC